MMQTAEDDKNADADNNVDADDMPELSDREDDSEDDEEVVLALEPIYESRNVYRSRKLPHVIGTQSFLVSKLLEYIHNTAMPPNSRWAGWALAHPEFVSSVNPITTRGADYAHHITASPPGFENPAESL